VYGERGGFPWRGTGVFVEKESAGHPATRGGRKSRSPDCKKGRHTGKEASVSPGGGCQKRRECGKGEGFLLNARRSELDRRRLVASGGVGVHPPRAGVVRGEGGSRVSTGGEGMGSRCCEKLLQVKRPRGGSRVWERKEEGAGGDDEKSRI